MRIFLLVNNLILLVGLILACRELDLVFSQVTRIQDEVTRIGEVVYSLQFIVNYWKHVSRQLPEKKVKR